MLVHPFTPDPVSEVDQLEYLTACQAEGTAGHFVARTTGKLTSSLPHKAFVIVCPGTPVPT